MSPSQHKVLIASDHAGFELKQHIINNLRNLDGSPFEWVDLGPHEQSSVDYPDYADRLIDKIDLKSQRGVLICGSGQGMAMRANKHSLVRAALCYTEEMARLARQHNNAQIICLGARLTSFEDASKILTSFFKENFEGGRHQQRIDKVNKPTPSQKKDLLA